MKHYFITPIDTLFFREGQPFQQGETTSIESAFPPTPRTLQGAIRTCVLKQQGLLDSMKPDKEAVVKAVGSPETPKEAILGPTLARKSGERIDLMLPLPRFWIRQGNHYSQRKFVGSKRMGQEIQVKTSWTEGADPGFHAEYFPYPYAKEAEAQAAFLSWSKLQEMLYLKSNELELPFEPSEPLFRHETRSMVAIDEESGSKQDGMLNFTRQIRLQNQVGFLCSSNFELKCPTVIPFGGLGRLCHIELVDQVPELELPDQALDKILEYRCFWLVLLQPARFPQSWPDTSFFKPVDQETADPKLRLLGALVGPQLRIGGFDFAQHRPAAQHAHAPAGSAYLFAFEKPKKCEKSWEQSFRQALKALQGQSVLGEANERRMGFGQVIVAPFNPNTKL